MKLSFQPPEEDDPRDDDQRMRGYMGSTPDGGIDDHDEEVQAPAKLRTYAEMLEAGIDAADTLKAIGARIGYGRAQQILGEEWELRHGCAPRGRMGVTANDAIATAQVLRDALRLACDHIDMGALRISHCKDAAAIEQALAAPLP